MGIIRFGVNGWRARVGDGFNEDSVVRITHALGKLWAVRNEGATVLVGYDTRRDSKRLAVVASQVLAACGLRAMVSSQACPTPALSWSVARDRLCVGGVVLTASQMPCEYGGLVVRGADGGPITPRFAAAVDQAIEPTATRDRGIIIEYTDVVSTYLDALVNEADRALIAAASLRVVVDTMYGAGCEYAANLFRRLGCEVIALHEVPISDFRGLHPDAREPWVDECERAVRKYKADMGIVFDGDCTRFAVIDEDGKLVSPHDLAPLVLEHVVRQRGAQGRVVSTAASSVRIARQAERLDCDYTMTAVGVDALYREFYEGDVILATDETGAITVPSHFPERDGMVGAVMLTELVAGAGESMRGLVEQCEAQIGVMEYAARTIRLDPARTQRLRNLLPGLDPSEALGERPDFITRPGGLRAELQDGSWLFLAPSYTGSGARAVCEAPTRARCEQLLSAAQRLASS